MLEEPQAFPERLKDFLDAKKPSSPQPSASLSPSPSVTLMISTAQYYYPNRMGRIILLSMEEVMGRNGVNAILKFGTLSSSD